MSDMADELTLQVLRQIRDEIVTTRTTLSDRIDHLETPLSGRIERLDEHLSARIDHVSERVDVLDGTMNELAEQQSFIVHNLRRLGDRDRRLEGEVDDLRGRVEQLEKRIPG